MNTKQRLLAHALFLLAVFVGAPGPVHAQDRKKILSQALGPAKVAEGEYLTFEHDTRVHESWVLWRTDNGSYVVGSDLRFEDPSNKSAFHLLLTLSKDLRAEKIETTNLTPPNYKTNIQLTSDEVRVKDRNGESKLQMPPRYDIYFPLTAWPLSSFARRAGFRKGAGVPLVFAAVDEVGPEKPPAATMLQGRAQCLGWEELNSAGQKLNAIKYLVHLGPYPGVFVWLSEEGLVLAAQNEESPEQRTEMVRFRKLGELPKLLLPVNRQGPD